MAHAGDYGRLMIDVGNRTIDPNHFANALLTPFALAFVGLIGARKPGQLLFALAATAIVATGVLMSLSREALVACAVMVVVVVAFSKRRVVAAAIGLPLLAIVPILIPAIGERMVEGFSTGGAGRTSIWQTALLAWKQHPWFGWGTGGVIDAYDRSYLAVYQAYNAGWGRPPHNTPLHALVELGVVGFVLMSAAYLATFRQFRGIVRGSPLYDLRVGLCAALIGLGVVSLFIDLAAYKYLWLALCTIAQLRTVALLQARAAPAVVYEARARDAPVLPRRAVASR
jgi:O-antigen ligase